MKRMIASPTVAQKPSASFSIVDDLYVGSLDKNQLGPPGIAQYETAGKILSGLHAAQAQHERHRMRRRGLKPVVFVKLLGLLVKGMHEKGSYARVLRYGHRAIDRVLQQGGAQVQSLRPAIDRKPGENHDRNRIRHVASHAARCELVRNGAGRHGVVTVDAPPLVGDDEGAACAT